MGFNEYEEEGSRLDKRRGMALKSKLVDEIEDEKEDSEDEEIAMYPRRFKRFMRKKKPCKRNKDKASKEEPKKEFKKDFRKDNSIICYKCNKLRPMKQDFPLAKKYSNTPRRRKGKQ